jgi:hypothetical protein
VTTKDQEPRRLTPRNRAIAVSKVRRSPKHFPVCLAPLGKIATRRRSEDFCATCQAPPRLLGSNVATAQRKRYGRTSTKRRVVRAAGMGKSVMCSRPNMALQRTRRPRIRSGRSRCSLGSPLNAVALGVTGEP